MARPCAGKDPLLPCFNYMESNIAGMLGTGSLLKEGRGGRKWFTKPLPSLPVKAGLVLFENYCKTKESGSLANTCAFSNNVISFLLSLKKSCANYYMQNFIVRFL